jgi:MFS family permease
MGRYQWLVLFAAWLCWGFDIFDGLLFSFVAPNCVPTLLHIPLGTPEAKAATADWNGILTSLLLIGWAIGGILFGRIADRIGRTKTLMLTMLLYSFGTAACAFAVNMPMLIIFRLVISLGIGGEWAAGAAMVAEVVPERRRVDAGAILYTSAPFGLMGATLLSRWFVGDLFKESPELSWRYLFLCGLIPAMVAFVVRKYIKEPEQWKDATAVRTARISDIFTPEFRKRTIGALLLAVVALITWWSCNAFISVFTTGLAQKEAFVRNLDKLGTVGLVETWKLTANAAFNVGGLIGTLITIPVSKHLGRKAMFAIYFVASAAALLAAFGIRWAPEQQLLMYFPIGLSVFGVFGAFTYYLPELYPTWLRATGAGFTYNTGRIVAAAGPFIVGTIAAGGLDAMRNALFMVGFAPILGLLALLYATETKGLAHGTVDVRNIGG